MIKSVEILTMIRPEGGWVARGHDFEGIECVECEPVSQEEYNQAILDYPAWKVEQENKKAEAENQAKAKRQALLDKLGITEEEARLLLS